MSQRAPKQFLLSANAIQAHVLFLTLIVVLSLSIWEGKAQPDYLWGLVFAVVAWPVVLGLLWLGRRQDEQAAVQHAVEALTDPEKLRRKRAGYRRGTLVVVALLGTGCVYAGARGWLLNGLPAQYVGYTLYAFAGLGMLGVNVWYGGPLDPRLDPEAVMVETDDTEAA